MEECEGAKGEGEATEQIERTHARGGSNVLQGEKAEEAALEDDKPAEEKEERDCVSLSVRKCVRANVLISEVRLRESIFKPLAGQTPHVRGVKSVDERPRAVNAKHDPARGDSRGRPMREGKKCATAGKGHTPSLLQLLLCEDEGAGGSRRRYFGLDFTTSLTAMLPCERRRPASGREGLHRASHPCVRAGRIRRRRLEQLSRLQSRQLFRASSPSPERNPLQRHQSRAPS